MTPRQPSLFESSRMSLEDSLELSIVSLAEYGQRYNHWAIAYSGGKDSTATVAFVTWAILTDRVPRPDSLTVLYADTRMELPPLHQSADRLMRAVFARGFDARWVMPPLDERFYVYMLGYGVPPPKNRFRWCTPQLKVEPMQAALLKLRNQAKHKLLMLTGVRLGESAARDQRIALSCSKDSGECGQGWFQVATPGSIADTLAPLLHWRLCHVYDWLYLDDRHGLAEYTAGIAAVYGEDDIRTGCIACNLINHDTAILRLIKQPTWAHLSPLLEIKPLYKELTLARNRKRKAKPELRKDGKYGKNVQRLGPLTMEARAYGLEKILDIQARAQVDLINSEEEARIREMWDLGLYPRKWSENDITGDIPIDALTVENNRIITQSLLIK